ncbi:MAG: cyclase family protein [Veillonellaceae bacterium]|nr:cyclase family protein [Veillonellaceae bacterium]
MEVYDISMSIYNDMPVYKGRVLKRPVITVVSDFGSGSVYETKLEMNMHTGTHIDAPLHIFPQGGTIDKLDLHKVVTRCKVFDFTHVEEKISQEHLMAKDIQEGDFILLKTRNSYLDILEGEFVYLDYSGAEYLSNKKIIGVGIDALGIERNQPKHDTHKALLGAGIIILEGLWLREIAEDEYLLAAAPLRVLGAEAAPVRALLIKNLKI